MSKPKAKTAHRVHRGVHLPRQSRIRRRRNVQHALAALHELIALQRLEDQTDAVVIEEGFPFLFRIRVMGRAEWTCPRCGAFNTQVLFRKTYTLRCSRGGCLVYGLGQVAHVMPRGGRHSAPPDYIIPTAGTLMADRGLVRAAGRQIPQLEPMPAGELGRWKQGSPMHRVRIAPEEQAAAETEGETSRATENK